MLLGNTMTGWGGRRSPSYGQASAYGGGTVLSQTTGYRDVRDDAAPDWTYRQFANGTIQVLTADSASQASVGAIIQPGSTAYNAVIARIGNWQGQPGAATAGVGHSTTESDESGGPSGFFAQIADAIQKGASNPDVQEAAAGAVQTFGPSITEGVSQLISGRGKSLTRLYKDKARLESKIRTGKWGLFSTEAGVRARYDAVLRQIAALEAAQTSAQQSLTVPGPTAPAIPWVPIGLGSLALIVLFALLLGGRRRR